MTKFCPLLKIMTRINIKLNSASDVTGHCCGHQTLFSVNWKILSLYPLPQISTKANASTDKTKRHNKIFCRSLTFLWLSFRGDKKESLFSLNHFFFLNRWQNCGNEKVLLKGAILLLTRGSHLWSSTVFFFHRLGGATCRVLPPLSFLCVLGTRGPQKVASR